MKICAITMVYRDYWALAQWVKHHSALVGLENLYIVAHGKDEKIDQIAQGANVITVPRDTLEGFDLVRGRLLNGLQASLSQVFEWVIRTDADELIVYDPERYSCLSDILTGRENAAVFALGCDLYQLESGYELAFAGHYSKAFAVTDDTRLFLHGVRVRKGLVAKYPYQMPPGLYLLHLKYADLSQTAISNQHRENIANQDGHGLPGVAWKDTKKETEKVYNQLLTKESTDFRNAESVAYDKLGSNPIRDAEKRAVRCRKLRFDYKTQPPVWFPNLES